MALDTLDKKILFELSSNARQTNSSIAKKARTSKVVVGYRIERMQKAGIIKYFQAQLNVSRLGVTWGKVFCRFQDTTETEEEGVISYLKGRKDVTWVARCDGRYDLAYSVRVRDQRHFYDVLAEIHQRFGKFITDETISSFLGRGIYPRKYLISEPPHPKGVLTEDATIKPTKVDEVGFRLLAELSMNARASSTELSRILGVSDDAIRSRMRHLEREQVIAGYTVVLDNEKIPQFHYKVLIRMEDLTPEKERMLHSFCRLNPYVFFTVTALGPWQFEMDMEVESPSRFRSVMRELKATLRGVVRDYSPLLIYKIYKYRFWEN